MIIVSLPGDYGKQRPAVIVQQLPNKPVQSVIFCPITSTLIPPGPVRPTIAPQDDNGLRLPSQVMVDKITTLPVSKAGQRIGTLSLAEMTGIDKSLASLLGLSEPIPPDAA